MLGCDNQHEAAELPKGQGVLEEQDALRQDAGLPALTFDFGFAPDDHRLLALAGGHALAVWAEKNGGIKATIKTFNSSKRHSGTVFGKLPPLLGADATN